METCDRVCCTFDQSQFEVQFANNQVSNIILFVDNTMKSRHLMHRSSVSELNSNVASDHLTKKNHVSFSRWQKILNIDPMISDE